MNIKGVKVVLFFLVCMLLIPFSFSSVDIVESMTSLQLNASGTYTAQFHVRNLGGFSENVSLSATALLSSNGSLNATLTFSPGQFLLAPNEEKTIQLNLNVVLAAVGQYISSVMATGSEVDSMALQANVLAPDTSAPVILSSAPSGRVVSDTTVLTLTTDEYATCKFNTVPGVLYENMPQMFDVTQGFLHTKSLSGLTDGNYRYYIRCMDQSGNRQLLDHELTFAVDRPPSAKVEMVSEGPLKAGVVEVLLLTSEDVKYSPKLSYSYDGSSKTIIPLAGSGSRWTGYFIVNEGDNNKVGSFQFEGTDLSGNVGNVITEGAVFLVDTEKPKLVSTIIAVPQADGIKVKWYDEQSGVVAYHVYRKESKGVEYTDFYRKLEGKEFVDASLEPGKTYYYRVAAIDAAGNEAELSKEVSSTALLNDSLAVDSSLAPELVAQVDRVIAEVHDLLEDIALSQERLQGEYSEYLSIMGLQTALGKAKSDAEGVERELNDLKQQNIDAVDLEKKLERIGVKLETIRHDVPENVFVVESDDYDQDLELKDVENLVREVHKDMADEELEKFVEENLFLKEKLDVRGHIKVFTVGYLDGRSQDFTVILKDLTLGEDSGLKYVYEDISKAVAVSISELSFSRNDYTVVKEDPIVRFDASSGKIGYSVAKRASLSDVRKSKTAGLKERSIEESNKITGLSFIEGSGSSVGLVLALVIVVALGGYYAVLRREGKKEERLDEAGLEDRDYYGIIEKALEFLNTGHVDLASNLYHLIMTSAQTSPIQNRGLYRKIVGLKNEIDLAYLDQDLGKIEFLAKNGQREAAKLMMPDVEFMYENLEDSYKLKIIQKYAVVGAMVK